MQFTKYTNLDEAPQLYIVYYTQSSDYETNFEHVIAMNPAEAKKTFMQLAEENEYEVAQIDGAYAVTGEYKHSGITYQVEARAVHTGAPTNP